MKYIFAFGQVASESCQYSQCGPAFFAFNFMLDSQLARVLLPTPQSLAHRTRIASIISPLKRVRPRVPFYDLAAHRIPTLWSLYRGLLREVPGTNVRQPPEHSVRAVG